MPEAESVAVAAPDRGRVTRSEPVAATPPWTTAEIGRVTASDPVAVSWAEGAPESG